MLSDSKSIFSTFKNLTNMFPNTILIQNTLLFFIIEAFFKSSCAITEFFTFRIFVVNSILICYNYFLCISTNNYIRIMCNKDDLPYPFFISQILNQLMINCTIIKVIFWLVN